jgi:hypothetical protein
MPTNLTPEIINAAILGFEQQKTRMDAQIAELRAMLVGDTKPTPAATPETPTGKRKISAAARRRMALGQQKRWAAIKGTTESPSQAATPEPSKPKRRISEEGMKRIIAATKKRWAAKRAAAKKAAPAVSKKGVVKKTVAKAAPVKTAAKKTATKKGAKAPAKAETQPTA